MPNENPNQIGELWAKTSANNNEFLSGRVTVPANAKPGDVIQIVAFKNDRKPEGSKAPDWRILLSTPRENAPQNRNQAPTQTRTAPTPRQNARPATRPAPAATPTQEQPPEKTL
jgi:uncharacterized protein (DUF736 family)